MFDETKTWVEAVLGTAYRYTMDQWVETTMDPAARYCVIQAAGGPAPDVEDRRPNYRIVLIGRRAERGDAPGLVADAEQLMQAALEGPPPCGAANIRAIGEPAGPGFTTENRAWAQVTFQVLF